MNMDWRYYAKSHTLNFSILFILIGMPGLSRRYVFAVTNFSSPNLCPNALNTSGLVIQLDIPFKTKNILSPVIGLRINLGIVSRVKSSGLTCTGLSRVVVGILNLSALGVFLGHNLSYRISPSSL